MTDGPFETSDPITTPAGTFRIQYHFDPDAESPREWCNVGRMVLSHRRYDLPSEDDHVAAVLDAERYHRPTLATIARWLRVFHGATVVLPVWAYEHGAIAFHAGDRIGQYADRWDSGLAGLIFDTPETREDTGVTDPEVIAAALAGEVELYSDWSNGMFVGRVIERMADPLDEADPDDDDAEWSEVEDGAVWGFESVESAREDATMTIGTYTPGDFPSPVLAVQV